ncbi:MULTISPECIES: TIGR02530 family flagellar biosynthesis protein [unclassified Paenibacillus]|uniref:TIGR02530 family flagellar biosynthesis protein n=1 Tax=Paenibacillus provencensis TaxID=441151 RepID=A0ABW3PX26_9BACL|nr:MULTISPECIES: TIGR02530 family flagellar biosynthesis protein [unclassified Paenibacillus]MCM3128718.1 flagellar biosynthesis protein [Paenibacillus sp. MER 78]SFS48002.1 flagellar operon protein [Paenibacillus sp. 453mf]
MSNILRVGQLYTGPVSPGSLRDVNKKSTSSSAAGTSFQELLNNEWVKLSQHASKRLAQRGIELGNEQLMKLGDAIDKAAAKGAKETLVLMQDTAFIVNVPNRTVVTAVNGGSMSDNVFTQIDSAVIIS